MVDNTSTTSVVDPHCFECGSGSSIFWQCGYGSGSVSESRVLMTKIWKTLTAENFFLYFFDKNFLGLRKGRPNYRRSLQTEKENIQYFKTRNFFPFMGHHCPPGSGSIRTKWLQILIRIQNTGYNGCQAAGFNGTLTVSHMLIQYMSAASGTVL